MVESSEIRITVVALNVTVQTFTLFKHCTAFITAKGRSDILFLERLHSSLALHKSVTPRICPRINRRWCMQSPIFFHEELPVLQALKCSCFCGLLSSCWPLLLVEAILQYAYKRSVCPSPAFWTVPLYLPIHVSFPELEMNQKCLLVVLLCLLITLRNV